MATLITRHALHHPERTAVVFEQQRLTYREFAARVGCVGNMLKSLGVGKADRVATVLPNCLELLEIYWSCPSIGAVLVPLSALSQQSALAVLLGDARPKCIITSRAALPAVAAAAKLALSDVTHILVVNGATGGSLDYAALSCAASSDLSPQSCGPDDPYNIMYTSGTTGLPKGILHTHHVRAMYGLLFGHALALNSASVVVHSGSIVFNGAFLMLLPAFYSAARYVLAARFEPGELIECIKREQATHMTVVPSQIIALLNAPGFNPQHLTSLECITSVGAPLPRIYKDRLNQLLPGRLREVYGLTEGFATLLDGRDAQRKADSVGVPLGFSRLRVVREDDSDCAPGEAGEIIGQSPILMSGYYGRPDLTAQAIRGGWLYTGDIGFVDEEGFLRLVDRKKDMIDSAGMKIYPRDVEEIAIRHPAVREVAVFGVPHEKWGETPIAAVLLREAVDAEALRGWINERVAARYQRVSKVVIMQDFPRTVAGKTLKRELREPYWRNTGRNQ